MSVTLTPQQFAMLDSKVKDAIMSASASASAVAVPAAVPVAVAVAAPAPVAKPKKVLSPEHLAKMKAGREKAAEAAKAAKAAKASVAPVAAVAAVAAPVPVAPVAAVAAAVAVAIFVNGIALSSEQIEEDGCGNLRCLGCRVCTAIQRFKREGLSAVEYPPAAAGSVSSDGAAKRKGPKKLTEMTPEERAAHDVKIAERKVAREALSPEEKEAAKAAAALKKAAKEALKPMKADPVEERAERAPSPVKEKAE